MRAIKETILLEDITEENVFGVEDIHKGKVISVGGEVKEVKLNDIVLFSHGRKVDNYVLVYEYDILVILDGD